MDATATITKRLAGHPAQYFTLKIVEEGKEPVIHTSKSYTYILSKVGAGVKPIHVGF